MEGRYNLCNMAGGSYTVSCSADDFDVVNSSRTVTVGGQSAKVDFVANARTAIKVTSPNGGEDWAIGSDHYVSWTSTGATGLVDIDYSSDSGATWTRISSGMPGTGAYLWRIPNSASEACLVRATSGSINALSDAPFAIGTCFVVAGANASPSTGMVPLVVSFHASAASTPCMSAVTYDWEFGDGSSHSTEQNPLHRYSAGGNYTWRLTVAIAQGAAQTLSGTVVVEKPDYRVRRHLKGGS